MTDVPPAPPPPPELGWDDAWAQTFAQTAQPHERPARVSRVDRGGWLLVEDAEGTRRVRQHARYRRIHDPVDVPTIGDWVVVDPRLDPPLARTVLERRTLLVRQAADEERARAQPLAANVDLVVVVAALDVPVSLRRLDRFLSLAWASGAQPVIVLSKADACADVQAAREQVEAHAPGVPVVVLSAVTGEGLDEVGALAQHGRTLVLVGQSGAGKSTLANRLAGGEILETADVRRDGKGRHTTVRRELVVLSRGGVLIDTPGLRSVGLLEVEEGTETAFADVEELASTCHFSDCGHGTEPGCAVREALEDGRLDPARFDSWQTLQRELAYAARKQDAALQAAETRRWRALNRDMRGRNRP